ncbi:MAG: 2,3-bisphosphoglycerate-independent phosphoglycerate mutase [Gemmatimonadetes bacterium]|nr:2,3-bisphosphoglycerate-independent phosphoglycerate mutase [Gemmatimonadota bacterium]
MSQIRFPDALVERGGEGKKIVLFVLDGLGGLPHPESGLTELEAAKTPSLDALAAKSSLGALVPVLPGITPGSGPGHLSLFGYDPAEYIVGRGALSALGVGFDLQPGDLAARLNLATLDSQGLVQDRRAGRPPDEEGRRVVEKVREALVPPDGVQVFLDHEKEHRAVLILRGEGLKADLSDTDPQDTGVPPLPVVALDPESERSAGLMQNVLNQIQVILADEKVVTGVLARGFAAYGGFPSFEDRYGLKAVAIAQYPMYRGVARLVGMDVRGVPAEPTELVSLLEEYFDDYDFFFLHFKYTDSRGEDGDFDAKVQAIESVDPLVGQIQELGPEVLVVTGDHSTPATYKAHSWHSLAVLMASPWARPTAGRFGETGCRTGDLGTFEGKHLMTLALAHASRLAKFGA